MASWHKLSLQVTIGQTNEKVKFNALKYVWY